MSNHKFKVGDKIVRTGRPLECVAEFDVLTVSCVSVSGAWLGVEEYTTPSDKVPFAAHLFELAPEQPAVDSTAVLAPLKVFEHILAGTPLECRAITSTNAFKWTAVKNPDCITPQHTRLVQYRVKPQTVVVNGADVPASTEICKGTTLWSIDIGAHSVYPYYFDTSSKILKYDKGLWWSTEEDAQAVLDAILTSFSK